MRAWTASALALSVFAIGFGAAAQTPLIGQADIAMPGGVYTTLNVSNAAACAELCADDAICMAWTYRQAASGACELKAVTPQPVAETGAISGLSRRAPEFARQLAAAAAAQEPKSTPTEAPPISLASNSPHPVSLTPASSGSKPLAAAVAEAVDSSNDLLGGPTPQQDLALRPELPDDPPTQR